MKITGTFLDEISHDIPHQNWGRKEWDQDFAAMKAIGIDTVILIRCGWKRFLTYPSEYLMKELNCFRPPVDLVDLFLDLAEKYNMRFFFGLYDSHHFWQNKEYDKEKETNLFVAEEVWKRYGHRKAFSGWYINQEISRASTGMIHVYRDIGRHVKALSGNLECMISPYIEGVKAVNAFGNDSQNTGALGVAAHEKEWDEILSGIQGAVDTIAFQDGHVDFDELSDFLAVNKALADKYGMNSWTNCESFDRDMPIRFLPIKWEKLLLKLEAARKVGMDKAITFEFSHFMSPNSSYRSANGLYERYREHFNI